MKLWSKILLILLLLTALVFITSLFFEKHLQSSYALHFDARADDIFEQINRPENWGQWSSWLVNDSLLSIQFSNKKVGKNAGFQWTGANGSGSFSITESRVNRQLSSIIRTDGWNTIYSNIVLTPANKGTTVQWTLSMVSENPVDRIMGYFYKGWMLRDIKRGLRNLHRHLFNQGKTFGEIISIQEINMKEDTVCALMLYDTLQAFPDKDVAETYFNKFREEMKQWHLKQHHMPFVSVKDTIRPNQLLIAFGMGFQDLSRYKGHYPVTLFTSNFISARFAGPSSRYQVVADSLRKISVEKGFKTLPPMYITFSADTIAKGLYRGVFPVSVTLMKDDHH